MTPVDPNTYNESYYTTTNYAGYLQREERYRRMVEELEYELFRVLNLDFKETPSLDFGCGVGYVVAAQKRIGYKLAYGFDVSEWAVNWGHEHLALSRRSTVCDPARLPNLSWRLMTAFDVFEHMSLDDVRAILRQHNPQHLLVRIPLTNVDSGRFILEVSENDPTHVTRLTRGSWHYELNDMSYDWLFDVNLGCMYDTDGVMCSMFRRKGT